MRQPIPLQPQPEPEPQPRIHDSPVAYPCTAERNSHWIAFAAILWIVPWLLGVSAAAAQSPATPPEPAPAHRAVPHHAKLSAAVPIAPPQATPTPVQTPVPEAPHWPANDHPVDASVTWDSQGLSIHAANSSLQQILNDFSAASGAKVEGLGTDQRVFGAYGPGQARDVLSQLLQGSGYNVLMIGDQGQGTPREIVLTPRQAGDAQPAKPSQPTPGEDDADVDEPPPQPAPVPGRPGFNPGANPRDRMQEIQQRRLQMEQNQQQGQPMPPPGNPPN